jgi:hypothetical protein
MTYHFIEKKNKRPYLMVNAIINRPIFIHRYVIGHCNKMWSIVTKGYYNLYMRLIMDFLLIFLFNWYVLYWCKNKITYTFNYILFLYHYFTILVFKISLQLSFLYESCIPIKLFFFFLIFVETCWLASETEKQRIALHF